MAYKLKPILRYFQEFLERHIFGSFLQDLIWSLKHHYQKDWTKISLESKDLSPRNQLAREIASVENIKNVLEIGCAAAPKFTSFKRDASICKTRRSRYKQKGY